MREIDRLIDYEELAHMVLEVPQSAIYKLEIQESSGAVSVQL